MFTISSAIIRSRYTFESLLACSIPSVNYSKKLYVQIIHTSHCEHYTISFDFILLHLQVKRYAENIKPLHLKIHSNSRFIIVVKEFVAESR